MADGSQSLQSSSLVYLSSEQFMPALDDEKWITLGSIPYRFVTPSPFLSRTETTVFRLHNPVISRKWEVRWQPFCGVLHPHQRQFYCFVQCLNLIFFHVVIEILLDRADIFVMKCKQIDGSANTSEMMQKIIRYKRQKHHNNIFAILQKIFCILICCTDSSPQRGIKETSRAGGREIVTLGWGIVGWLFFDVVFF